MNYCFLLIGLILYGLLGSPTPDNPALVEAAIFICLFCGLWPYLLKAVQGLHQLHYAGFLFLSFASLVPLLLGILADHQIVDIFRDYIALGFLLLPLLAVQVNDTRLNKTILAGVLIIALLFTLRSLVPALNITSTPFERLYLTNSPLLLFAALFAVGWALKDISYKTSFCLPLAAIFILAVCFVTLQNEQRATIVLLAAGTTGIFIANFYKKPFLYLSLGIGTLALLMLSSESLMPYFETLYRKHIFVGANNRDMEWQAIVESWQNNPLSFLLGNGWGARLLSSAAGPTGVNFVHGLLPNLLFKTGIVGLALGCLYLVSIAAQFLRNNPPRASIIAVFLPLLLMVSLYGSYKSLDFGLLLLFAATYKLPEHPYNYKNISLQPA